jgi:hypothetical protein
VNTNKAFRSLRLAARFWKATQKNLQIDRRENGRKKKVCCARESKHIEDDETNEQFQLQEIADVTVTTFSRSALTQFFQKPNNFNKTNNDLFFFN